MIKPYSTIHAYHIKDIILAHGFDIIIETRTTLTEGRAGEFYAEHEGKAFYPGLVSVWRGRSWCIVPCVLPPISLFLSADTHA